MQPNQIGFGDDRLPIRSCWRSVGTWLVTMPFGTPAIAYASRLSTVHLLMAISTDDPLWRSRQRNHLATTLRSTLRHGICVAHGQANTMEILDLSPREFDVAQRGVYVIDDDERVIAGPFSTDAEALKWIEDTAPQRKHLRH